MSLAEDYLDRWVRRDVEACFRGHGPRSIELARARLIGRWRVHLAFERLETQSFILFKSAMSLIGGVTGHAKRADGHLVAMTRLVWVDRNGKWERTKRRLYRLGDRSDAAESQQRGAWMNQESCTCRATTMTPPRS